MHVIAVKALRDFWAKPGRQAAKGPLQAWFREAKRAAWTTPADIKARHRSADFVANDRVIFNVGGNKFRLVVAVKYAVRRKSLVVRQGMVFVKFVGTHEEYDEIDPATIRYTG